jgi:hypothetical protein
MSVRVRTAVRIRPEPGINPARGTRLKLGNVVQCNLKNDA